MVIQEFSYFAPKSVEEACSLLYEHGEDAKALAGGQSLIPLMKLNLVQARYIVDLKRIPGLSFISVKDSSTLEIGALTKHSDVEKSEEVRKLAPLLSDTAAGIGHPLIRNRGTIGGSLSHCDPAADYCPAALVLETEMTLASHNNGRRVVPASEFIKGTFETALKKGEILEKIVIPVSKKPQGYSVKKLTLGHGDFPLITVSVIMEFERKERKFGKVAIALGGVSEKAFRVKEAERLLLEKTNPDLKDFEEASRIAEEMSEPQADIDVSASYKRRMIAVIAKRALVEAFERSVA
jgi:aerobic carbon-monoxide dehydrogenase medium subunit